MHTEVPKAKRKIVSFIDGDDDKVAKLVKNIKRDYREARGVVLAKESAVEAIENYLKTIGLEDDKNILLAGINNKKLTPGPDKYFYILFVKMLNLTIELLGAKTIDASAIKAAHKRLGFNLINPHRITFEPDALPMTYDELKEIYPLQEFA